MGDKNRIIRFDWAAKRLLRNKANFGVLEGFLTVLLDEKITIVEYWRVKATRSMLTTSLTVWISRRATARMR